jgi:hypothetical protein
MRSLLSFVFQLALLTLLTFSFVVLFEHGPQKFVEGAKTEWDALLLFVGSTVSTERSAPSPQTSTTSAAIPSSGSSPGKATHAESNVSHP